MPHLYPTQQYQMPAPLHMASGGEVCEATVMRLDANEMQQVYCSALLCPAALQLANPAICSSICSWIAQGVDIVGMRVTAKNHVHCTSSLYRS